MSNNEETIIQNEQTILKEEKEILNEIKKEGKDIKNTERTIMAMAIGATILIFMAVGGLIYWKYSSGRISIDKSQITAPTIQLSPATPGILQNLYVRTGDSVLPDTIVAQVDNQIIKTKVGGLVIDVQNDIGKRFNPGEAIVTMIDPNELRVIGQVEEDKGLKDIQVGQQAEFTVDAFGSRKFYGTVDSISPTSRNSDIVFSISDARQMQEFDVKVRYSLEQYPELKNGMSAKLSILKN